MTSPVAVVTIVSGRHDHLARQRWGLGHQVEPPHLHVVVAMDDPSVEEALDEEQRRPCPTHVVHVPRRHGLLPLAAARNAGVAAARERGARLMVLLDVDCIPTARLVDRYRRALAQHSDDKERPVVTCGAVRYLDEATSRIPVERTRWERLAAGSTDDPRRIPGGGVREVRDLRLFWSLSFATTSAAWDRIGGFDEGYLGYGGEDTDFGQRLGAADGTMLWVGDALAYHQHHESHDPPLHHVAEVVDNATRFEARWGWLPMRRWLSQYEDLGLVVRHPDGRYETTERARTPGRSGL